MRPERWPLFEKQINGLNYFRLVICYFESCPFIYVIMVITVYVCDVIVYPPRWVSVSVSEMAHNVGPEQSDTTWEQNDVVSNVHDIMCLLGLCDHDLHHNDQEPSARMDSIDTAIRYQVFLTLFKELNILSIYRCT